MKRDKGAPNLKTIFRRSKIYVMQIIKEKTAAAKKSDFKNVVVTYLSMIFMV